MVGIFLFLLFLFFCAALIGAHELSKNTPAGAWSKKTGAESDLADPSEFKGALAHNCLCHATIFFVLFFFLSIIPTCGKFQILLRQI